MAGRSRSSFNKRQKERSRQEKQREKAERRVQRKLEKQPTSPEDSIGEPQDFSELPESLTYSDSSSED
jgi:hypothetical protein